MKNLFEVHKKSGWNPFDEYKVKLHIVDIVGGIPQNPDLIKVWVDTANKKKSKADREHIRDTHEEMLPGITDAERDKKGIGFLRMKDGQLCIEGRQVKSMLKESSNIIRDKVPTGRTAKGKPIVGIPQLKSKVGDQVFVEDVFISVGKTEPDAVLEKPIHVQTRQGDRDSIKVYEICYDVDVEFTIRRFTGIGPRAVPEAALSAILDYGQSIGLGADRSQGHGRFKVISIEKVA